MNALFSIFKSIGLLLLTVLAVMLVNKQFMSLAGLSYHDEQADFLFSQWQLTIFYISVVGAVTWALYSKWFIFHFMKVRMYVSLPGQSVTQTYNLLGRLSDKLNIQTPQLAIYDSPDINAFTTGFSQQHSIIVVSSGLLYSLNYDEQEAVLAHELTHIANHDMLTLSLIQGVINILVMLPSHFAGWLFDKKLLQRKTTRGVVYYFVLCLLQMSMGFIATMLVMWFSRWREFNADKGAAELVGKCKMQTALSCLNASQQQGDLADELGLFGISGNIGKGIKRVFASHPPLNERIMALREDWH